MRRAGTFSGDFLGDIDGGMNAVSATVLMTVSLALISPTVASEEPIPFLNGTATDQIVPKMRDSLKELVYEHAQLTNEKIFFFVETNSKESPETWGESYFSQLQKRTNYKLDEVIVIVADLKRQKTRILTGIALDSLFPADEHTRFEKTLGIPQSQAIHSVLARSLLYVFERLQSPLTANGRAQQVLQEVSTEIGMNFSAPTPARWEIFPIFAVAVGLLFFGLVIIGVTSEELHYTNGRVIRMNPIRDLGRRWYDLLQNLVPLGRKQHAGNLISRSPQDRTDGFSTHW